MTDIEQPSEPPVLPAEPPWPLHQLATFELRDYRRQLEQSLKVLKDAPVAPLLQTKLRDVVAEQDRRQKFAENRRA